ncbi:MAG: DUF4296 domain-containing protein [Bacteroidales bacterium]|nr:DUF4296 domain-containing protein [Candidatus Sodaliphilus aphodohippi]
MKKTVIYIFTLLLVGIAVACDKAPNGVIPESKMVVLITDLQLAESYITGNSEEYSDDSSRLVLKQSIFEKHGVTPELYDTSLVWYAANMDVYANVYDRVVGNLQDMRKKASNEPLAITSYNPNTEHRTYKQSGDSADIWTLRRQYMLTPGLKRGFITFDLKPDREYARGDRYELQVKILAQRSHFHFLVATDYNDGTTSYITRSMGHEGWNNLSLQSDSTRSVRRIYGYINYEVEVAEIAYLDSISMLRTHLSPTDYQSVTSQKFINRNTAPVSVKPQQTQSPRPPRNGVPAVQSGRPAVHVVRR